MESDSHLTFFWDLWKQVDLWGDVALSRNLNGPMNEEDAAATKGKVKGQWRFLWAVCYGRSERTYPGSSGWLRFMTSDLLPPGRETTDGYFSCGWTRGRTTLVYIFVTVGDLQKTFKVNTKFLSYIIQLLLKKVKGHSVSRQKHCGNWRQKIPSVWLWLFFECAVDVILLYTWLSEGRAASEPASLANQMCLHKEKLTPPPWSCSRCTRVWDSWRAQVPGPHTTYLAKNLFRQSLSSCITSHHSNFRE